MHKILLKLITLTLAKKREEMLMFLTGTPPGYVAILLYHHVNVKVLSIMVNSKLWTIMQQFQI